MRVALMITCLVDQFYPQVGEATVRLLHRLGADVDFPEGQTCCGQPAFNSGYLDEAREVAVRILDVFDKADYVVSPSGSCTGMIHHYYPELFRDEPVQLAKVSSLQHKIYELSQFLVDVMHVDKQSVFSFPYKVTYHPSCHGSRILGVKTQPEVLLNLVKGMEKIELPHANDCCGFGGTFAVKMGQISSAMVEEKVQHVMGTQAEVLVGTDMGCLMNIGGRLRRNGQPVRVMHLAELLYEGMIR